MLYFNLKEILLKRNLTINKVSAETKISRPALTAMYNNESKGVQLETLEKLMDYLDVPLNELIKDREEDNTMIFTNETLFENAIKKSKIKESFFSIGNYPEFQKLFGMEKVPSFSPLVFPFQGFILYGGNIVKIKDSGIVLSSKEEVKKTEYENSDVEGIYPLAFNFFLCPISIKTYINQISIFLHGTNRKDEAMLIDFFSKLNIHSIEKILNYVLNSWYSIYDEIDQTIVKNFPKLKEGLILITINTPNEEIDMLLPTKVTMSNKNSISFEILTKYLDEDDEYKRFNKNFKINDSTSYIIENAKK